MSRLLITGLSNTGKTSLLKTLKDVLVISRDGKPFSLELPHFNVPDFTTIDELLGMVSEKLEAYKKKYNDYPRIIAFDSVSRIFTDIENSCNKRFRGFDVWTNVNKEITSFVSAINDMENGGYDIVLIAHCTWDEKAGRYVETSKGSFAKMGGFLSVVDYAINIDIVGKKRIVTYRGISLARTLLDNVPDMQEVKDFNLQNYLEAIRAKTSTVTEKWSI